MGCTRVGDCVGGCVGGCVLVVCVCDVGVSGSCRELGQDNVAVSNLCDVIAVS